MSTPVYVVTSYATSEPSLIVREYSSATRLHMALKGMGLTARQIRKAADFPDDWTSQGTHCDGFSAVSWKRVEA